MGCLKASYLALNYIVCTLSELKISPSISTIIVKHNLLVQYHSYEDDTHIYLQCDNTDDATKEAINRLEKCTADVCAWMKKNSLKHNEDET